MLVYGSIAESVLFILLIIPYPKDRIHDESFRVNARMAFTLNAFFVAEGQSLRNGIIMNTCILLLKYITDLRDNQRLSGLFSFKNTQLLS